MLIFDEAARVSDELHFSARPLRTLVEKSQLVMLSNPFGQQGFFFETWERIRNGAEDANEVWVTQGYCRRFAQSRF